MNNSKAKYPDIHIAHVITESGPFGGAQRNTLLTLKGLARNGYRAELVCGPGGPLIREAEGAGIPVHVISSLVRPVRPWLDVQALFRLWRLFRLRRYRIVHTHSTKAGLLGRIAAWCAGVPVIIHTVHGVPFTIDDRPRARFFIALERRVGRITHCIVCVGEVLRQEFIAWKIAPRNKLITVYSGLQFDAYASTCTPAQARKRFGVSDAWPVVGCIGRLSEAKAQFYLVEAIAVLKRKYPKVRLLLVGEGDMRCRLAKQIRRSGLSAHVALLGERSDIADILNALDIYAMSSQWEGVGRALSEAMYWGLPIVATPVNGVREIVIHGETGLLAPPRDPPRLADAIDRLAADPRLARRLGDNARRKAKELMDSRGMIEALEELYGRFLRLATPRHDSLLGAVKPR